MGLVSTLREYQAEIGARMRGGDAFASVEEELIDPSPLSEKEKAALWLFGWSFVDWRHQRREALTHIEALGRLAQTAAWRRAGRPIPVTAVGASGTGGAHPRGFANPVGRLPVSQSWAARSSRPWCARLRAASWWKRERAALRAGGGWW